MSEVGHARSAAVRAVFAATGRGARKRYGFKASGGTGRGEVLRRAFGAA